MADAIYARGASGAIFARNSDHGASEVQLVETYGRRPGGGALRAQYLDLFDLGAHALVGSRRIWQWGFEHGVNEFGVAIGKTDLDSEVPKEDPYSDSSGNGEVSLPVGLIGTDLVRLGLERGRSSEEALQVITRLLEAHGQRGVNDRAAGAESNSGFLIADGKGAWVLETKGSTWAARRVGTSAAVSDRITMTTNWERSSSDVAGDTNLHSWRDPKTNTDSADVRLKSSRAFLSSGRSGGILSPRDFVSHLRSHGGKTWGSPGSNAREIVDVHSIDAADLASSICMHDGADRTTNASIVAWLPGSAGEGVRAWIALGSPCCSVFFPVLVPGSVPFGLAMESTWRTFAALRDRVELQSGYLGQVRSTLGKVEDQLWREADNMPANPIRWQHFTPTSFIRVEDVIRSLERSNSLMA